MKKLIYFAIFIALFTPLAASAQNNTFFQKIAGNWEGTLEYQDYTSNKRVKLRTYLTVTPLPFGDSADFFTVYDDVSHIVKNTDTVKIDAAEKKYFSGNSSYAIDAFEDGKIVLLSSGQDGEKVEPIRETITYNNDSLIFLKETRTPWQFRNQLTLKRSSENVLAKRTLAPAQMKEDLAILKKTLVAIHPGVYRYQTPESLEKMFAEYESKVTDSMPEAEFFKIVAQITSRLDCGHTFINPYNLDTVVRERVFNGKSYLPFYFRIVNGKMIVTESTAPENLSKGSEITKINGVSAKQIINSLLTVTKGDGTNALEHRIDSIGLTRFEAERYALFDMYYPLFYPLKDESFTIEAVDFASKQAKTFRTAAMTKEERTAAMEKKYGKAPNYDDGWKFEIQDNSTAYLKIDNSITWRLKTIKFKEYLADAFAQMRAKDVKTLIIDLRGNGGGDMNIGFELSKYLAQKPFPVYAEGRRLVRNVAPQPDIAKYLDTYDKDLRSNLQNGVPPSAYRKAEGIYYEILPNENLESFPAVMPYENNFRGKAYIIADSAAASATFQFLEYAQRNKLAQIVGQASGGNKQGINGGNYFFLTLPNSKAEVDIPVYFQSPLTRAKDESIIPDVPVKRRTEDVGNNYDREVVTIKNLSRANKSDN